MNFLSMRWVYALAQLNILMLCLALSGGFVMQFVLHEIPCPLCYLQRIAMMVCAVALSSIVYAARGTSSMRDSVASGYGLACLAAMAGACVSTRQILLHVLPGDPGFGTAVLGLHLYTWGLVVFFLQVVAAACVLISCKHGDADFLPAYGGAQKWLMGLVCAVIVGNLLSVFAAAGWNWGLPADPVQYLLFK